jgi:predicted ribosomally synthesized peptide with nif11-like leader
VKKFVISQPTKKIKKGEKRMSIENAKVFLERVKNDEDLLKRLKDAQSGEDRLSIAEAEGFEFTKEEMFQVQSELGEEELARVAGGFRTDCTDPQCCLELEL